MLVDQFPVFFFIQDRVMQQSEGKRPVFLVFKHRKQRLICAFLFGKPFDCFQDKALHNLYIVVPVYTFILENIVQFFIHIDKLLEDLSPELTILIVGGRSVFGVFSVGVRCQDGIQQIFHECLVGFPHHGAFRKLFLKLCVLPELKHEFVVEQVGIGMQIFFRRQILVSFHLHPVFICPGQFHH